MCLVYKQTFFFPLPPSDVSTAGMDGYNESSSVQLFLRLETGCYCARGSKAFGVEDYSTDLHSRLYGSENNCPTYPSQCPPSNHKVQPSINECGICLNIIPILGKPKFKCVRQELGKQIWCLNPQPFLSILELDLFAHASLMCAYNTKKVSSVS